MVRQFTEVEIFLQRKRERQWCAGFEKKLKDSATTGNHKESSRDSKKIGLGIFLSLGNGGGNGVC